MYIYKQIIYYLININLVIVLSLFLLNCENKYINKFPEVHQSIGKPIENITMFSKGNVGLCVVDTFLVIQKGEEKFIQIYSTNSHELLIEFGLEGRGPGEFMGPSLKKFTGYDKENESPIVYVFDFKRQMLNSINILKIVNGIGSPKQESLPFSNFVPFLYYKQKDYYLASTTGQGRFLIYDAKNSNKNIIPYLPNLDFTIHEQSMKTVYRSAVSVDLEKGLIAAAPLFLGELNFFDLKGNLIRSSIFEPRDKFKEELKAGESSFENIKYYIEDLDVKNELIYALNYNTSVNKFSKKTGSFNVKVQVFDWKGQPIKEYHMGDRLITSFAIDSNHKKIYAYSPTEREHTIIKYDMN